MPAWWQERVVYQIYPRSFQDSNNDGIGDIPGIIQHLDDLKDLGVGIIWLSPVYCSPDADNGYDISNYREIDPKFGTMPDMLQLIAEAKERDIKIVMDLVINHTSDQHEWFKHSRDPQSPYRDYYIWRPGKDGKLPNNWTGFFGGPCWTFDQQSGEYYLHLFAEQQPDLNYNNPAVIEEVKAIMRFWLDLGIAGFRCDVINLLSKDSLEDGKRSLILTGSEHYLTREGTHEILRQLRREVLDNYDCFTVGETVFVTPAIGRDLCEPERRELNMIFIFEHMETDQFIVKWFKRKFSIARFGRAITRWQNGLTWNANYLENHDQPRSVSRFGARDQWAASAKLLATLLLTLRGTPFIYQGQEIGITNFDFTSMDQIKDVESIQIDQLAKRLHFPAWLRWRMIKATSRDNARTPMQWNDSTNGGFSSGTPWIGVNHNYITVNLAMEKQNPDSVLNFYKKMIKLRADNEILKWGTFQLRHAKKHLLVYDRILNDEKISVILNYSPKKRRVDRFVNGKLMLSSLGQTSFNGCLLPFEAVILSSEVKL